jgi:peptidoglycan/xylan/chitin deacetylase (PgdA/CDA1 family)
MVRNFLFHRVNPVRERLWDPMDVTLFERCIEYITEHYTVVLFEDLIFSQELHANKKFATIMFDDGYKDNMDYARAILDRYKCKASFYVVTDCIDKNIPTWTHILEHRFQYTNISEIDLNFDFLPEELKIKELLTKENRIQYVLKLKPFLKKLSHENRSLVLDKITHTFSDIQIPRLMMTWDDLRVLRNDGHYVGSHTATHPMLGTMQNESEIKYELEHAYNRIQEEMGYAPTTISYPIGSFNERVKELSKDVGYKVGLAVKQHIFDPCKEDVFEISRIELYNDPWWKTRLRITNTLERIKSLMRYK